MSMCVKGKEWEAGDGGVSGLDPAILGGASCQRSIRHLTHVNHSSCQIEITAVL